ncbi:MAG: hypothetical protein O7F09_00425 [Chloroflexi bacterium]|nr:hypothetical protein [Chloroflexota bacterium]
MRDWLIAVVLLALASAAFYGVASLIVEFSQEEPDFNIGVALVVGLLAWAAAAGVLLGVSRASQTMHRVGLALIIPVGIVIATVLMISGLGVVLLTFANFTWECTGAGETLHCEADELITSVKEIYAVLGALLVAFAILGVSAWLARRSPQSQVE